MDGPWLEVLDGNGTPVCPPIPVRAKITREYVANAEDILIGPFPGLTNVRFELHEEG
jgi:hypothetical protein